VFLVDCLLLLYSLTDLCFLHILHIFAL
jgi:hypothetical protein